MEVEYTDEFEPMSKSFKNLIDKMPKQRREKIEERSQEILLGMALQELRKMRKLKKIILLDKKNSFLYICINFNRICKKNHINLLKK